jgi:hypothetical protein
MVSILMLGAQPKARKSLTSNNLRKSFKIALILRCLSRFLQTFQIGGNVQSRQNLHFSLFAKGIVAPMTIDQDDRSKFGFWLVLTKQKCTTPTIQPRFKTSQWELSLLLVVENPDIEMQRGIQRRLHGSARIF